MHKVAAIAAILLCLSACSARREKIEFCAVENGKFDTESLIIDVEHHRARGSDTSYDFRVVELPFARGFLKPFPFVLPSVPLSQMPPRWETGEYEFTMSAPADGASGWALIDGRTKGKPVDTAVEVPETSVLYSFKSGALAVRLNTPHVAGELFFCGTAQIRGDSF